MSDFKLFFLLCWAQSWPWVVRSWLHGWYDKQLLISTLIYCNVRLLNLEIGYQSVAACNNLNICLLPRRCFGLVINSIHFYILWCTEIKQCSEIYNVHNRTMFWMFLKVFKKHSSLECHSWYWFSVAWALTLFLVGVQEDFGEKKRQNLRKKKNHGQ